MEMNGRRKMISFMVLISGLLLGQVQGLTRNFVPSSVRSQRIFEITGQKSEAELQDLINQRLFKRETVIDFPENNNGDETRPDFQKTSQFSSAFHLHNSHLHLMVHWVGKGSERVFCLGKDQEMKPGATSQVFLSKDYGKTFKDISAKFVLADGKNATIDRFYHHDKSNCHYIFTDTVHK